MDVKGSEVLVYVCSQLCSLMKYLQISKNAARLEVFKSQVLTQLLDEEYYLVSDGGGYIQERNLHTFSCSPIISASLLQHVSYQRDIYIRMYPVIPEYEIFLSFILVPCFSGLSDPGNNVAKP